MQVESADTGSYWMKPEYLDPKKIREYEQRAMKLCREAIVRLERGCGETTDRFPRLYCRMCAWECKMRRRLDVLATICMEFDLDSLRDFARLKKELKEMGTGFMPGKEKQWMQAVLYHRCRKNDSTCECYLARNLVEDVEELRRRVESADASPPPVSTTPSIPARTFSNLNMADASDKDGPIPSSNGNSLSASTSSSKPVS
jgi:hypothetical protein